MVIPEFMIPLKKQDLLKGGNDHYVVKSIIEFSECLNKLSAFKKGLKNVGCDAILQNFDLAFSFLYDFNEPSFNDLQKFYDEILSEILERIVNYTENAMSLETVGKMQAANVIKMTFYIFSLFLKTYEEKISFNNDNFISEPKRKKGTKTAATIKNNKNDDFWIWNEKKKNAIAIIFSFLQLPISNIWQKPVIEDAFINLLGNCCYRSLESPDINLIKWKPLRDSVAQVLGLLVSKHNHGLTFVPRVVQLMKQYEHAAAALSSATLIIVNDYGCPTLLSKMIKELHEVVQDDPQILGKAAGIFITDLAENDPTVFKSSIRHLSSFLNIDAYPVRNSILTTFTEMILKSFSGEDLSSELKKDRDFILTKMQEHMHDENAYVRSKVLQLWTKLASAFCIPRDMYTQLMEDANYHLMDKSTYVSKNAIHFFTNALVYNPYAGRFLMVELNAKLEKEKKDLKQLLSCKPLPPEEVWKLIEIKLIVAISEVLKEDGEITNGETIDNNDSVEISDVMLVISKLVKDELFIQALSLLRMTEKLYPESTEIRCNVESNDKVEYYVSVLKKIFLITAKSSPKVLVPEYYENSEKIIAQTEMIKYTEGSIKFVEAIEEAGSSIETLMFCNSTPEVLEAIDFFSNAYKFKIEGSAKAVRNMLSLVKSTKPELKEAVGKAYRSLYLETSKTTPKAIALQVSRRLIKLVKDIDENQKSSLEDLLHSWISSNELDKEFIMVLLDKISANNKNDNSESDLTACLILLDMISRVNSSLVPANYMLFKNLFTQNLEMSAVRYLCSLLMRPVEKIDGKIVKYHKDYELFQTGIQILVDKFDNFNSSDYINLATSVVDMIFQLCFHPEELSNELLFKLFMKMKEHSKDDENKENMEHINEILLGRLIFLCGHIIFRKYQYCDKDVFNALKRCMNGVIVPEADKNEEDYLDISADNEVAADDALYEEILRTCDANFFKEGFLTDQIKTVVINICKNFKDTSLSDELKAAAAISLSKFMMVSQTLCEEMFPLYMTIMDKSDNEVVKSNLIMAFGDLLCRFPNVAEPWTSYLYSRMVDSSSRVRKSAVSILCYLISREMIKVRGHIADLVIHLEDMEAEISEKVRCLLFDLSRKGNTLYNVIPDIISNLSNPERKDPVSSSTFKTVIGHIFSLVTKEKQNDLLVEKLCLRLKESTSERQSEDIVFCLSQIFYSEKSLRKLLDYLPLLIEKFAHPPILTTVQSIISTCSKSSKPNIKELAVEASSKLEELMTEKDEDKTFTKNEEGDSSVQDTNKTPIKSPNNIDDPPKTVRTRRTTAKKKPKPSQTPQRSSRRRRIQNQFLSDSEGDE